MVSFPTNLPLTTTRFASNSTTTQPAPKTQSLILQSKPTQNKPLTRAQIERGDFNVQKAPEGVKPTATAARIREALTTEETANRLAWAIFDAETNGQNSPDDVTITCNLADTAAFASGATPYLGELVIDGEPVSQIHIHRPLDNNTVNYTLESIPAEPAPVRQYTRPVPVSTFTPADVQKGQFFLKEGAVSKDVGRIAPSTTHAEVREAYATQEAADHFAQKVVLHEINKAADWYSLYEPTKTAELKAIDPETQIACELADTQAFIDGATLLGTLTVNGKPAGEIHIHGKPGNGAFFTLEGPQAHRPVYYSLEDAQEAGAPPIDLLLLEKKVAFVAAKQEMMEAMQAGYEQYGGPQGLGWNVPGSGL